MAKSKCADVSPILKKGSRSKLSNYRPVSLTSQVSKTYESILIDAIMEHLVKNQLLRDSRHGFLRGRSCFINLLTFLDKVTDCVDKGIDVDVIFLDLAKCSIKLSSAH